jgi:hypothetical protein
MTKQALRLAALLVAIAVAIWGSKFAPDTLNEAITLLGTSAAGLFVALIMGSNKGGEVREAKTLQVNPGDEDQATLVDDQEPKVSVNDYNAVVRKHNKLAIALKTDRSQYDQLRLDYEDVSARFGRTRLHSRALRIAFYLAAWESFIAIFTPRLPATTWPNLLKHFGPILVGAFVICWVLIAQLLNQAKLSNEAAALRCAGLGCFAAGFIACAVSLPYRWAELVTQSTIAGCNMASLILIISLLVLPIAGILGSFVASALHRTI